MAKKKEQSTVHAVARAYYNPSFGYGHIDIHVYDLLGYGGCTLKITCQTGGHSQPEAYAWNHGIAEGSSSVIGLNALKIGYFLMMRIDNRMKKIEDEYGRPRNFADYATRVLRSAGIPVVHVLERVNGQLGLGTNFTDLPGFHPERDLLEIRAMFERMEKALVAM